MESIIKNTVLRLPDYGSLPPKNSFEREKKPNPMLLAKNVLEIQLEKHISPLLPCPMSFPASKGLYTR